MDKDLKKIIDETVSEFFDSSPMKMVEIGRRTESYDICPHCKTEIYEKHEYTEDGGTTWRHSDCKGLIDRPEEPIETFAEWLQPFVQQARKEKYAARKSLGLTEIYTSGNKEDKVVKRGKELFDMMKKATTNYERQQISSNLSDADRGILAQYAFTLLQKKKKDPDYDPYDQDFHENDYIWDNFSEWPREDDNDPDAKDFYRHQYWQNSLSNDERSAIRKKSRKMGRDVYFNQKHKDMFIKKKKSNGGSSNQTSGVVQPSTSPMSAPFNSSPEITHIAEAKDK